MPVGTKANSRVKILLIIQNEIFRVRSIWHTGQYL